jgi:hypothetical protein
MRIKECNVSSKSKNLLKLLLIRKAIHNTIINKLMNFVVWTNN